MKKSLLAAKPDDSTPYSHAGNEKTAPMGCLILFMLLTFELLCTSEAGQLDKASYHTKTNSMIYDLIK